MRQEVIFRPRAEDDVQKIYQWYDSQQPGLGEDFLESLRQKIDIVRDNPESSPIIYKDVRRMILFLIVVEKTKSGFSAYSPDVPGCIATASTKIGVEKKIREAIQFHIEGLRERPQMNAD